MLESLIIIVFNIIVYFRSIWYGLIMDDTAWWATRSVAVAGRKDNLMPFEDIKDFHTLKVFITHHFYSGTTFGVNTKVEHAFTIFLHTTVCVLMYHVLGNNHVSFWAAMLYACNPINNQTSLWLNGRRYVINIILVLSMLAFPMMAPLLYISTGLFQVTAFFSPILLMKLSPWFILLIPIFLAIGWKEINARCKKRTKCMAPGDLVNFKPTRIIMVIKTFGFFFFKMLIPGVCSMQYPDRLFWGLTKEGNKDAYAINGDFWKGMASMVIIGVIIALAPQNARFYAIFMGLAILQWSALLPITQILSDRYCSLPNVFVMFFMSYFTHMSGIFYIPIMVVFMAYYLACLSVVMPMYKDLNAYYTYHMEFFPHIPWPRTLLISDLMSQGEYKISEGLVFEGLRNNPTDYCLLKWGSIMHLIRGDLKNAQVLLNECEKNFYLGQEAAQGEEVNNIRHNINKLMPKKKGFR